MRNRLNWVLPVVLMAVMAAPLWAQQGEPRRERPDGPPPRERGPAGPSGPSATLQRLTDRLGDLNLTAEQKAKMEALIAKTAEEVKAAEKKLQESMQAFRKEMEGILEEEQLRKANELTRQGQGPMAAFGGEMVQRMREAMEKLELTAEQKEKIKSAFDILRDDAKELLEAHRNDPQALREAMGSLMERAREKAKEILTAEQLEKMRNAIRPQDGGRGGPGAREGRDGQRGGREGGNAPRPPAN